MDQKTEQVTDQTVSASEAAETSLFFPFYVERYFDRYYALDCGGVRGADQCVYQHSNRLCVVAVAPSHELRQHGRTPAKVEFKDTRLHNKVRGKRKKGGMFMEANTAICDVTCDDGSVFTLFACIRGFLLEINNRLLAEPKLLLDQASAEGFIAIINPKLTEVPTLLKGLAPHREYLEQRGLDAAATDFRIGPLGDVPDLDTSALVARDLDTEDGDADEE